MKRFLVFGGDDYYPAGGWDDFIGDADEAPEFVAATPAPGCQVVLLHEGRFYDWAHAIDTKEGTITSFRVRWNTTEVDAKVEGLDSGPRVVAWTMTRRISTTHG